MASSKEYLDFILEQLSELEEISYRAMMGEYIIYYRGKIIGGIYDDRFLVKPIKSAIAYMPNAKYELPNDGAKEMLLVDDVDNTTTSAEISQSTSVVLTTVAGNKNSIGYVSLGSLNDTVKAVKVDGVDATVENI